jgi:hypothetical protein
MSLSLFPEYERQERQLTLPEDPTIVVSISGGYMEKNLSRVR